ncbi:unnamed protein product [Notodromas monacha]|uniref:Uncharacterized protein n=1 Tax=Notodromas monacha TaxID=399045 RepID=A0A7R9GHC4_9CRUS|nr:unnamed protein product [Notodromas monacha]CAG0921316.1 unnamed protein product [Notodromas monacha]
MIFSTMMEDNRAVGRTTARHHQLQHQTCGSSIAASSLQPCCRGSAAWLLLCCLCVCFFSSSVMSAPQHQQQQTREAGESSSQQQLLTSSSSIRSEQHQQPQQQQDLMDSAGNKLSLPKPVVPTRNGCACARIFYPDKYLRLERKIFADCMSSMGLNELQSEFLSLVDEIDVVVQTMDMPDNMTRRDDLRCFLDTNRVHFRETAINKLLAAQGTDTQEQLWRCWGLTAELLDSNDTLMPETLVFDIKESQGPSTLKAQLMDDARRCGCKYYKPNTSTSSVTKLLGEYFLCAMEKCFI